MGKFFDERRDELTLHVSCLAWLNATPRPPKGGTSQPRLQGYIDRQLDPPLPPPGCAGHLVGFLFDAGPVGYGAAGPVPLQWQDLTHWQFNTGVTLSAWEAVTLRHLSAVYAATSQEAESPTCPAPWLPDSHTNTDTRKTVAKHIRSVLRS